MLKRGVLRYVGDAGISEGYGRGGVSASNEATLSAYSVSLSLRNLGKGVRRLLLWTLSKEVIVTPIRA